MTSDQPDTIKQAAVFITHRSPAPKTPSLSLPPRTYSNMGGKGWAGVGWGGPSRSLPLLWTACVCVERRLSVQDQPLTPQVRTLLQLSRGAQGQET